MSKIYICRTNRSSKTAFERLLSHLVTTLGSDKVYYYNELDQSSIKVEDCQILVIIATRTDKNKGYIGRGVKQQIDRAIKNNMKVLLFDDYDHTIIPFDKVYMWCISSKDMNHVANLSWTPDDKKNINTLTSLSMLLPYGVDENFASAKNINLNEAPKKLVNSLILKLRICR